MSIIDEVGAYQVKFYTKFLIYHLDNKPEFNDTRESWAEELAWTDVRDFLQVLIIKFTPKDTL